MKRALPIGRLLVLLAGALLGCGGSEPDGLYLDLLSDLPALDMSVESRGVDFASEEARYQLFRGFSRVLRDEGRELPFVRSEGWRSVMRFKLLEARDLELVLRGRPVPKTAASRVEIIVNSTSVETLELEPKLKHYRVKLPGSALLPGENRVVLIYTGDAEAVAWYKLDFLPGVEHVPLPQPVSFLFRFAQFCQRGVPIGACIRQYFRECTCGARRTWR